MSNPGTEKMFLEEPDNSTYDNMTYAKSNNLIHARGKSSLLCKRLFAAGISYCQQMPDGGIETTLKGTELRKIFGRTNGSFYTQIKELVDPISTKPGKRNKASLLDWRIIYTDDKNQRIEAINVINDCTFEKGQLHITFNKKIAKDIYNIKGSFTTFSLPESISLKSSYSFSLFELVKSEYDLQAYKKNKLPYKVEYDIVDLKFLLGVVDTNENPEVLAAINRGETDLYKYSDLLHGENTMEDYNNFKRYAIDNAVKEINEKTRLHLEYEPIKGGKGGKVIKIRFFITQKEDKKVVDTEAEIRDADGSPKTPDLELNVIEYFLQVKSIIKEDVSAKDIEAILKEADYDIDRIKRAYECAEVSRTDIQNITAWLITAIRNGYDSPVSKKGTKKNDFKNFDERTYDDLGSIEKELTEKAMQRVQ